MTHRNLVTQGSILTLALQAAALAALLSIQPSARAESDPPGPVTEEASAHQHQDDHSDHAAAASQDHEGHRSGSDADDPHRHHRVAPGFTRTMASYQIPDLSMVDQNGQRVSVRELLSSDKPTLVNFIFTTCTAICPVMSATFEQVQRGLAGDSEKVAMVSFSIDPEQDTPAELSAYAKRFDAGPQWQFITGSLEDSIAVQQAFDAYRGDKMNHAPLTLLRGTADDQWVRYDGFAGSADLVKESRAMMAN